MSKKDFILVVVALVCGILISFGFCGCTTMVKTAEGFGEGAILDAQYAWMHLKDGTKKAESNVRKNDAVLNQGYSD